MAKFELLKLIQSMDKIETEGTEKTLEIRGWIGDDSIRIVFRRSSVNIAMQMHGFMPHVSVTVYVGGTDVMGGRVEQEECKEVIKWIEAIEESREKSIKKMAYSVIKSIVE